MEYTMCKRLFNVDYEHIKSNYKAIISRESGSVVDLFKFRTIVPSVEGRPVNASITFTKLGRRSKVCVSGEVDGKSFRTNGMHHSFDLTIPEREFDSILKGTLKRLILKSGYSEALDTFRGFIDPDWMYDLIIDRILTYSKTVSMDSRLSEVKAAFNIKQMLIKAAEEEMRRRTMK